MKQLTPRVLKQDARKRMQGNYGTLILATVLLLGCSLLLNALLLLLSPTFSGLLPILLYFAGALIVNTIYNVLMAGVFRLYRNLATNQPFSIRDLFYAFRTHPEPIAVYSAISLSVEMAVLSLMLFVVPAIFWGNLWLAFLLAIATFCLLLWFLLTFSCFLFLHTRDPWCSAKELFIACIQLMQGYRLRLLWLFLTFLGVLLLCILSLGIGLIFAVPYLLMTFTLFYEQLTKMADRNVN